MNRQSPSHTRAIVALFSKPSVTAWAPSNLSVRAFAADAGPVNTVSPARYFEDATVLGNYWPNSRTHLPHLGLGLTSHAGDVHAL